jgi:pilus assembly protein Flp/PilA
LKLTTRQIAIDTDHGARAATDWQGTTMRNLVRFLKDEQAATAIEYGLIAAGISVAIITVVAAVGSVLNTTFTSVSTALK